jgi:hypothetical protein
MNKVQKTELNARKSRYFLLVSFVLILLNLKVVPIDEIAKKIFGVSFSSALYALVMLWLIWIYLLLQFIYNYKTSNLNVYQKIAKEFDRQLAKYSRKRKERISPNLYTPQYLVTQKSKYKLSWECKYCQAATYDLEPSVTISVQWFSVVLLCTIATVKVLFDIPILIYLVVPIIAGSISLAVQLNSCFRP